MPLSKPYYRIYRPEYRESSFENDCCGYDEDDRYVSQREKSSLLSATKIILKDFQEILEYVEPCDNNKEAYSHRIYELLVRTCIEVEANLEGILRANGYTKPGNKNLNMSEDYYKVDTATKLSEFSVIMHQWHPENTISPFDGWKEKGKSLKWYKAYNRVKHDRFENFSEANLENLCYAICGLLCLLFSQFGSNVCKVESVPSNLVYYYEEDYIEIGQFTINLPSFSVEEKYRFKWYELKDEKSPYNKFAF